MDDYSHLKSASLIHFCYSFSINLTPITIFSHTIDNPWLVKFSLAKLFEIGNVQKKFWGFNKMPILEKLGEQQFQRI